MSKGDYRRPTDVPRETFESNWERIFNRKMTNPSGSQGIENHGKTRQKQTEKARKP
jgi:hypothetical protein